MAEIGTTLRETRMRRRIDIGEVEASTKIRAKYLRALENEEWDLLPGPTFIKTFLRTYAEYLEVDPKPLIEEYKQRYERPALTELAPFGTNLGGRRERRRGPIISPGVLLALGLVVLLGALFAIGKLWPEDGGDGPGRANTVVGSTPTPTPTTTPRSPRQAGAPRQVAVTVVAEGTVYVCLVDSKGRRILDGVTMAAGQRRGPYRGKRFRVTFGNGAARMRINGKNVNVPDRTEPVGFQLTPGKRRELGQAARPTCA
jgi:cytoskeleton protein RodZ